MTIGYCVYVRSFMDGDGDGVGDLHGLRSRLDHIADLGVDFIWITPVYPSPLADGGYDVADYCEVAPLHGGLAAFDGLVEAVHRAELGLVMDLVPNHTSIEHPWFRQERLAMPRSDDRYVWSDPAPDGGPPNNWVSHFGGSAWTFDPARSQYYLHLFLPQQPDLNWRSPTVIDDFDDIMAFWLDRGVDGFRVDAAQCLLKDEALRSNPVLRRWDPEDSRNVQWAAFDHVHDIEQPESLDLFRRWRRLCDAADAVIIGETSTERASHLAALLPDDGLHAGFWLPGARVDWDPEHLRGVLMGPTTELDPSVTSVAWVASTLDERRSVSRFGGGDLGRRRALAYMTALMWLPGVSVLYQGEELGLEDGVVLPHQRVDVVGATARDSRDGCRTPMPWAPNGSTFGFSTAAETWLPLGGRRDADTVEWQRSHVGSWFERHRDLIRCRHRHRPADDIPVVWRSVDCRHGAGDSSEVDPIVGFRRGPTTVLLNAGAHPAAINPIPAVDLLFDTMAQPGPSGGRVLDRLLPDQAVVVRNDGAFRDDGAIRH